MRLAPATRFPSTTRPPPTPVPMMTPNTTSFGPGRPGTTPIRVSARARQLASFSTTTGMPSRASRSVLNGCPSRCWELQPRRSPVSGSRVPGVPTPRMSGRRPASSPTSPTRPAMRWSTCLYPPLPSVGIRRLTIVSGPFPDAMTALSILVPPTSTPMRKSLFGIVFFVFISVFCVIIVQFEIGGFGLE